MYPYDLDLCILILKPINVTRLSTVGPGNRLLTTLAFCECLYDA